MSYSTWHDYGQGICLESLNTDKDAVLDLISLAPEYKYEFEDEAGTDIESMREDEGFGLDDVIGNAFDVDAVDNVGMIIQRVIAELEGVNLECCSDSDSHWYLIFPSRLAWNYNTKERGLTEEKIRKIFEKYISKLTSQSLDELDWGYHEIENGS